MERKWVEGKGSSFLTPQLGFEGLLYTGWTVREQVSRGTHHSPQLQWLVVTLLLPCLPHGHPHLPLESCRGHRKVFTLRHWAKNEV